MSTKLNEDEEEGDQSWGGRRAWLLATWAILSYYYWLDEKVANAILDSYLAKVMGGATYFTVYENHSKGFV